MEREAAVTVLQAHARGLLVRRRLRGLLGEYEAVVRDIEGERLLAAPHLASQTCYCKAAEPHREDGQHADGLLSKNTKAIPTCQNNEGPQNGLCMPEKDEQTSALPLSETGDVQSQRLKLKMTIDHHQLQPGSALQEQKDLLSTSTRLTEDLTETSDPGATEPSAITQKPYPERAARAEPSMPDKEDTPENMPSPVIEPRSDCMEWTRSSSVWSERSLHTDVSSDSRNELQKLRSHLAMEILWVQQAIASRKNYLMVRQRLGIQD